MSINPRQKKRAKRRALWLRVRSWGLPCAICGLPIDYSLPAGHPDCYELDEKKPVSMWYMYGYSSPTECALDPKNVQPVHRHCNQWKGNKVLNPKRKYQTVPFPTSRDWRHVGDDDQSSKLPKWIEGTTIEVTSDDIVDI